MDYNWEIQQNLSKIWHILTESRDFEVNFSQITKIRAEKVGILKWNFTDLLERLQISILDPTDPKTSKNLIQSIHPNITIPKIARTILKSHNQSFQFIF
jgi:hypothetical protein